MTETDRVRLDIGGRSCVMRLLTGAAPGLSRQFASRLPIASFVSHAKFAGEEVFFMVPFLAPAENLVAAVEPGDVGYYPDRQTVCIFYGRVVPFGRVGVFGRIEAGLEALEEVGPRLWQGPALPVRAEREA